VSKASHSTGGFTYIALLAAIIILGISLGAAGKYWQNVMMREKEEELLFRGEQYRLAIDRYFVANCGPTLQPCPQSALPQSIENLLSDDRFPKAKRHLRQKYQDPITGKDFEIFRDMTKGNRITGVYSSSDKEPIKKTGFPDQFKDLDNKMAYKDWKFVYTVPTVTVPRSTGRSRTVTGLGQTGTGLGQAGTGQGQAGTG
jgi:type II secretory pathway pseudopilin PulG